MTRRALIVGLDNYQYAANLTGCVEDAKSVQQLIQRQQNGSPNYDCRMLLASTDLNTLVGRVQLRQEIKQLFSDYAGEVFFYFSGHGAPSALGGYLATSDGVEHDVGIPMLEVMQLACNSRASDITMILDCCYAGSIGNTPMMNVGSPVDPLAMLRENLTVIAAARETQPALEAAGHGVFTRLLIDALDGGAADHLGWVTAPAIYSYVERHFGPWEQRPVYKSHATRVTIIRECAPLIDRARLVELEKLFAGPHDRLQLDPEFEPEDEFGNCKEPVNAVKVATAQLLKRFRDVGLIRPTVEGEQLYWTARKSHTVELTARGREYWRLVHYGRI